MPHPPELTTDALSYQIPVQFGMVYWGKLRPYHHLLLKRDYPLLDTDSLVKTELMYPVLRSLLADQYAICRLNDGDLRAIMGKVANSLAITMYYALH